MGEMHLSILSQEEVKHVHHKTLHLLESTGFNVLHDEILTQFKKRGADVNETSGNVRLPSELVMELLSNAPSSIQLGGLNGKVLEAGGDNVYYTSLILDPFMADWDEGIRPPTLADVQRNTAIGESLDRVSIMMRMQYPVSDFPEPDCYYKSMEVFLSNMTKHVSAYPDSVENCLDWINSTNIVAESSNRGQNDASLLSIAMAVQSPLTVNDTNIEIMKLAIQNRSPIITTVCPMAGSTAPYSVAGTFLQANIEALIPILIAQLLSPGYPVFYGVGPSITDMQSGRDLYYRAEKMLFKTMANQMSSFYNLPCTGEAGGSLTHLPDMQNGAESLAFLLASHAWKQNIIGGLGSLGNANGMSSEQIIMQCGLIDMAEHLSRGVRFTEDDAEVESIKRTGPGGNFLVDDLTLKNLRDSDEFFTSPYFDMRGEPGGDNRAAGTSGGGMYAIAHQQVIDIEAGFESAVPGNVQEAIQRYFHSKR